MAKGIGHAQALKILDVEKGQISRVIFNIGRMLRWYLVNLSTQTNIRDSDLICRYTEAVRISDGLTLSFDSGR